jgi:hypothetical protein
MRRRARRVRSSWPNFSPLSPRGCLALVARFSETRNMSFSPAAETGSGLARATTLEHYRSIRAEIQHHLFNAPEFVTEVHWERCAREIDYREDAAIAPHLATNMLVDAALFTSEADGERPIDRYVRSLTNRRDRAFARRLAGGRLSIWQITGFHPEGGIVVDDALGGRRQKQLMDEKLEAKVRAAAGAGEIILSRTRGALLAGRIFDAVPFRAAYGHFYVVSAFAAAMLRGVGRRYPYLMQLAYSAAMHGEQLERLLFDAGCASKRRRYSPRRTQRLVVAKSRNPSTTV